MKIEQIGPEATPEAARLAQLLWPEHTREELQEEFEQVLLSQKGAVFLAYGSAAASQAVGFAQCQLRHDYVEGTKCSPVGYLEGIYVQPDSRRQGIAGALLKACEQWASRQGCREFASDCELSNKQSLRFHLDCGFTEAGRVICFVKEL